MKTWHITGISRGLGAALARTVLARGDAVVGTVRGDAAPPGMGSPGLTVLSLDLDDPAAPGRAVKDAFSATGRITAARSASGRRDRSPISRPAKVTESASGFRRLPWQAGQSSLTR